MWDAVFRTDDVPKADRFDSWYQLVGGPTVPVIAHTEHPADFHAVTRRLDLDSMRAYSLSGSPPVRGNRTPKLVRQSDPEFYSLAHLVRGTSRFAQDDWAETYRPGDLMFFESSHPFVCWMGDDRDGGAWHLVQVQFPRVLLPQPDLVSRLIGKRLSNHDGVRTLLSGYLRQLVNLSAQYRPEDRTGLLTATINLITALLTHEVEPERPWDPDVQRTRILDFMRRHLADPNLNPAMIAAAHHMSTRTLHKLFQTHDVTIAGWIRRHRLENCRRDLTDPHQRTRPIHAIATRWGLTDNAHFSRLFRATYGISPAAYRHSITSTAPVLS
jgi:AraC-like DNA-binding protein